MNGKIKFHKANGPAFNQGEVWNSITGKHTVKIDSVRKFGESKWDQEVSYIDEVKNIRTKDAWNFQVRYVHISDLIIKSI
jgi:hypothetical protein